jgi:uncharacterized protein DUF3313
MKNLKTITVLFISLSFLLASAGLAASGEKHSGFIENYPAFEADKDQKGAEIYRKPGTKLNEYTKIMIDPIEIWYADDSKYKGITPEAMKALSDAFRAAIVEALEPDYPVVSKPGAGVLGLRLAITNIYVKKKRRGLLGYTPVGIVAVAAKKAVMGQSISLVNATIEVEMLDAGSNERLGVLIDSGPHAPDDKKEKLTSWEEVEAVLQFYAKRFRTRMDAEHGR